MLAVSLGHDDFTASNGWLEAWQKRFHVRLATLCGEAAEVPQDVVTDWTKRLPDITDGYNLADIYNADETGLYYRALPTRSMVVRDDPRKGVKTSKERVTVLLACSAAGEKLKPLVIGKAANPRCFRGIDKAGLPVTYRANRKAWMTSVLFVEWLQHLNAKMKLLQRHILLFVDNCGAHPDTVLSNVKLVFLPPNTTSRLQPCDAGIIANVKSLYRKRLLRHVLAEMDEANSASELAKRIDIVDAISWLHLAWTGVGDDCIRKCFARCGFRPNDDVAPAVVNDEPDDSSKVLLGDVTWGDYVNMDDGVHTVAVHDENWEAALIAKVKDVPNATEEANDSDEDEAPAREVISARAALDRIKEVMTFALSASDPTLLDAATGVQNLLQAHCIRQSSSAKQSSIRDFFKR